MGSIAAGGLIETFSDVQETFDLNDFFKKKELFALNVNGDSMTNAQIAHGDLVLMEPVKDHFSIRNGDIVSAYVSGLGSTLKYFIKKGNQISLEPANPAYEPIVLDYDQVSIQGKLLGVWRKM